jgi:HAD superfamily hydrolase (TIGR01509 family)
MPKAVLFDVDGTLIDTVDFHAKAWQVVLARHGRDVAFEDVRGQIGKGGDQLMPVFLPKEQVEREGKQIEAERLDYFKREFLPKVSPFPGVRALFERLRADGKRVALASSAKQEELKNYIKIADVEGLVDEAATADDADRSKPHPDIFRATLARLKDVDPADALAVGDTPYDAEAAGKAGLRTIGLLL